MGVSLERYGAQETFLRAAYGAQTDQLDLHSNPLEKCPMVKEYPEEIPYTMRH